MREISLLVKNKKIFEKMLNQKKSERDEILLEMQKKYGDIEWAAWFKEVCATLDQAQQPDQSQE